MDNFKTFCSDFEDHYTTKVLVNLFFDDKALIKVVNGNLANFIDSPKKWTIFEDFQLHFEKWNSIIHSHLRFIKGSSSWTSIKDLPLDY